MPVAPLLVPLGQEAGLLCACPPVGWGVEVMGTVSMPREPGLPEEGDLVRGGGHLWAAALAAWGLCEGVET